MACFAKKNFYRLDQIDRFLAARCVASSEQSRMTWLPAWVLNGLPNYTQPANLIRWSSAKLYFRSFDGRTNFICITPKVACKPRISSIALMNSSHGDRYPH